MAITSVNETFKNRKPKETVDGRTYIRTFIVVTDDPTDGGYEIFLNSSIPNAGDRHNKDSTAVCESIDPKLNSTSDDGCVWFVECSYTTRNQVNTNENDQEIDPVDLPPKISFGYKIYNIVADRGYTSSGAVQGNPTVPITNSTNQPFDPPLTIEKSNRVIRITRNESAGDYNPDDLDLYNNTVNLNQITIAGISLDAGQGKMRNIPAEKRYKKDGDVYYEVSYEIEVDRETHVKSILDMGYYTLSEDSAGGPLVPITDSKGQIVTEPQKLDGSGQQWNGADYEGYFIEFQVYFEKDWDPLNLPADDTSVNRSGGLGGLPGVGGSTGIGGLPGV